MRCDALAYHRPDLQSRWADFSATTRGRLATGVYYSGADYVQAQRVRALAIRRIAELFEAVDLILTPKTSVGAPSLSELEPAAAPTRRSAGALDSVHTMYWNVTGNPALTVPMGSATDGLPLGMQIVGRQFEEALVLRAGDAFQQVTDWHLRVPPILSDSGQAPVVPPGCLYG